MSLPRYSEYKDSGVEWLGELPGHWPVHSLRHHLKAIFNGITSDQIDEGECTVPVTRIETISKGVIDTEKLGYISLDDARSDKLLKHGDILFSNINSLNMIGNCAQYCGSTAIYAGMNLLVLRPVEHIDYSWLFWLIKSSLFRREVESRAKPAINQASIPQGSILSIQITTPNLSEQAAIASFLDRETGKIDGLIAEQEKLIALLAEKRQATISHAVTKGLNPAAPMKDSGVAWLGEVPAHWEIKKTSLLFRAKKGTNAAQLTKEYCATIEGEYPVYSGQTENDGVMSSVNEFEFDAGESGYLLSTTVGAKAMSVMLIKGRFSLSQNCMVIIPVMTNLSPSFYYYHLQPLFSFERAMIPDHMQPSFRMEDLYGYRIAVPPQAEQHDIAQFLNAESTRLDELAAEATHGIALLKERRSALISAAVTGKIDVRHLAEQKAA